MDRSQPKYHVLIVSINSSIRLEFQSYLHKILGAHIAFDTIGLDQVQRPEQIKGYQCILFSSSFHSPVEQRDAWDADTEYEGWQWWLGRSDGGAWELVTCGYG